MKKVFLNGTFVVATLVLNSCVSTIKYELALDKAKKAEMLLDKERRENNQLTDEKYSLEDFNKGKSSKIAEIQQKSQEAID